MGVLLFFLFILVPIAELYVIIQVGQAIGVGPTIGLMLLTAVAGAYLARSQGRQTWSRFNETMRAGKVPGREVTDGAMIIFGGALLLTPGFITDVLGISLLLPPSRAAYRKLVKAAAARTPTGRPVFFIYDRIPGSRRSGGGGSGTGAAGGSAASGGRAAGASAGASGTRRRPSRGYDVEGSAREIEDSEYALPDPSEGADEAEGRG